MTTLTVDELANLIRTVDGNNSLGAGALAEALLPFIERHIADHFPDVGNMPAGAVPLPMNTAPRDGTVIVLHWGEDGSSPGWWNAPVSPIQNDDGTWPTFAEGFPWAFIDTNNGSPFVNKAVDTEYGPTGWSAYGDAREAAARVDAVPLPVMRPLGWRTVTPSCEHPVMGYTEAQVVEYGDAREAAARECLAETSALAGIARSAVETVATMRAECEALKKMWQQSEPAGSEAVAWIDPAALAKFLKGPAFNGQNFPVTLRHAKFADDVPLYTRPSPVVDVEALGRIFSAARKRIDMAHESHLEQWKQGGRCAINFIEERARRLTGAQGHE